MSTKRESIVVLYDPATGDIHHVHHVISDPGADHPDDATMEKEAAHDAAKVKHRRTKLPAAPAFLHVKPGSFQLSSIYKVDHQKRALIKVR
jgi:hypothetical protein